MVLGCPDPLGGGPESFPGNDRSFGPAPIPENLAHGHLRPQVAISVRGETHGLPERRSSPLGELTRPVAVAFRMTFIREAAPHTL